MQGSGDSEGSTPNFGQGAADLQKKIAEEERLRYSPKVLEQAYNPKNMGRMPNPDAFAAVRGWCDVPYRRGAGACWPPGAAEHARTDLSRRSPGARRRESRPCGESFRYKWGS